MEPNKRKEQIIDFLNKGLVFHARSSVESLIRELGYRHKCAACHKLVRIAFEATIKVHGADKSKEIILCHDCLTKMGFIITDLSANIVTETPKDE